MPQQFGSVYLFSNRMHSVSLWIAASVPPLLLLLVSICAISVYAADAAWAQEEVKNPSLTIETITVDAPDFNRVLRDAPVVPLERAHIVSWQATIDNDLVYAHPNGNAVVRLYDQESVEEFVEIGMGANPDYRFWVAVQTPNEGYVVIHRDTERGWYPQAKVIASYTERAGMTVNNGARIVVSNLDIGLFAPNSYSVHGMEGSSDPPAVTSGHILVEFLSGDPSKNVFALFPFYVAAGIGIVVGALYLTKKR